MLFSGLFCVTIAAISSLASASRHSRAINNQGLESLELFHDAMVASIVKTLNAKRNTLLTEIQSAEDSTQYNQAVKKHLKVCLNAIERRTEAYSNIADNLHTKRSPPVVTKAADAEAVFGEELREIQEAAYFFCSLSLTNMF